MHQVGDKKAIILPVVLYECETWSLTLREEHRLRVFENKVLWRIFGPKKVELTREWRKPQDEEVNDPCSSPNIIRLITSRRIRWVGHLLGRGEVYTGLGGETRGNVTTWKTQA